MATKLWGYSRYWFRRPSSKKFIQVVLTLPSDPDIYLTLFSLSLTILSDGVPPRAPVPEQVHAASTRKAITEQVPTELCQWHKAGRWAVPCREPGRERRQRCVRLLR